MKKTILFVIALIVGISAYAQKIDYDKVNDNGLRVVGTSSEIFRSFTDRLVLSLSMSAIIDTKNEVDYFIDAAIKSNDPISAPANARMLIKTQTGEVLNLECFANSTTEDNLGHVSNVGGTMIKTYTIMLPYKVSVEEIQQIANEGVSKIRIELNGDSNYEKEWKKDKKIGPFIGKSYELLKQAISVDKRGTFEDDF